MCMVLWNALLLQIVLIIIIQGLQLDLDATDASFSWKREKLVIFSIFRKMNPMLLKLSRVWNNSQKTAWVEKNKKTNVATMPKKYTPVEILGKSLHTALPTLLAPLPNPHITQHSMPVIVAKTAKAIYLAFFLHLLDLTL